VVAWVDVFTRKEYRDIVIESYNIVKRKKDWKFMDGAL